MKLPENKRKHIITDNESVKTDHNNREIPHGTYKVMIEKLELVKSNDGDPVVICRMGITDGEYSGERITIKQVINHGFQIYVCNKFVCSLAADIAGVPEIEFDTYSQYGNLLINVMEAVRSIPVKVTI